MNQGLYKFKEETIIEIYIYIFFYSHNYYEL